MFKRAVLSLLLAASLVTGVDAQSKIPNLGDLKLRLREYKQSGGYAREVAAVMSRAQQYIERRAPKVTKPAIVLDIDETSLLSWVEMVANDFGYIPKGPCDTLPDGPCGVRAWEIKGQAEVIRPTLELFKAARAKGVAVFFVTGRPEDEREGTARNLNDVGYVDYQALIMRPLSNKDPAAIFKPAERANIAAQGYKIIANIGDQKSDLSGGYSEKTFLVPNPFYIVR